MVAWQRWWRAKLRSTAGKTQHRCVVHPIITPLSSTSSRAALIPPSTAYKQAKALVGGTTLAASRRGRPVRGRQRSDGSLPSGCEDRGYGGGGGGDRACYKCGKEAHMARGAPRRDNALGGYNDDASQPRLGGGVTAGHLLHSIRVNEPRLCVACGVSVVIVVLRCLALRCACSVIVRHAGW